ncbi:MAG: hypothetical protein WCG50_15645 [Rhodoferax sp.]|uniref:hypothetical protein n=1 Tax=Rhodoferax sp. TaxID=50421 RepID=UPI003015C4B6
MDAPVLPENNYICTTPLDVRKFAGQMGRSGSFEIPHAEKGAVSLHKASIDSRTGTTNGAEIRSKGYPGSSSAVQYHQSGGTLIRFSIQQANASV